MKKLTLMTRLFLFLIIICESRGAQYQAFPEDVMVARHTSLISGRTIEILQDQAVMTLGFKNHSNHAYTVFERKMHGNLEIETFGLHLSGAGGAIAFNGVVRLEDLEQVLMKFVRARQIGREIGSEAQYTKFKSFIIRRDQADAALEWGRRHHMLLFRITGDPVDRRRDNCCSFAACLFREAEIELGFLPPRPPISSGVRILQGTALIGAGTGVTAWSVNQIIGTTYLALMPNIFGGPGMGLMAATEMATSLGAITYSASIAFPFLMCGAGVVSVTGGLYVILKTAFNILDRKRLEKCVNEYAQSHLETVFTPMDPLTLLREIRR